MPPVSDETWAAAQAQLAAPTPRSRSSRVTRDGFPLRRFVTCAVCERPMTGSSSTGRKGIRYGFYHCKGAGCQSVPQRAMEQAFIEAARAASS